MARRGGVDADPTIADLKPETLMWGECEGVGVGVVWAEKEPRPAP